MRNPIPVNLVVEDHLSEAVLRAILAQMPKGYAIGTCYGHEGFGYLRKNIKAFNHAAKGMPWIVLTDLDQEECAPVLLQKWLGNSPRHPNLLFRVAVREVESWLLAHRAAFAELISVKVSLVPEGTDALKDAKATLIHLVEKYSPCRDLRLDIVPPSGSSAVQGPNYSDRLAEFVLSKWDSRVAMKNSDSLRRTILALRRFIPTCAPHRQAANRRKTAQTD